MGGRMRDLDRSVSLYVVMGSAALVASACGARTSLSERVPFGASDLSTGAGGASGVTVTGAGGVGGVSATVGGISVVTGPTTTSGEGGGAPDAQIISALPTSFLQAETSLARAPNGFVAVAWIDANLSGDTNIGYVISTDDGDSFPPPVILTSPGNRISSDPVIAVDASGNFYVTWIGYIIDTTGSLSDMHVYVAKAPKGSTAFGTPIEVSNPKASGAIHDKPWITVASDGTLVVTYAVASGAGSSLVASRSKDGVQWTESVILQGSSAFWNLAYPCAPRKGKRLWVTYLTVINDTKFNVGLTWSDDSGATWLPLAQHTTVSLPNDPVAFDDPTCVAAGNEVWVAYGLTKDPVGESESVKSYALELAHAAGNGGKVDARVNVLDAANAPFIIHPQMVIEDSGSLDFTYYAGAFDGDPGGSYRWARAAISPKGSVPSAIVKAPITFLTDRGNAKWLGDYTGLFWAGSKIYTSYVVNTTGVSQIAFSKRAAPAGAFR
jgi:hypothetical protein